jgi:Ca2+-binding EF-hand superfamily protein
MVKTRTNLLQERKKEKIPHISYDLDGDGYVGGRDLVIAKYFDEDKDGILNEKERANAMKALEEGFENKFVWGIE